MIDFIVTIDMVKDLNLSGADLLVYAFIKENGDTQLSDIDCGAGSERTIRRVLARLEEEGLIVSTGGTKPTYYIPKRKPKGRRESALDDYEEEENLNPLTLARKRILKRAEEFDW